MEKLPRQVYPSEFRQQAVEMITRDGLSLTEASRRLSISPQTLTNWVKRAKRGDSPEASAPAPRHTVTDAEAEREITEYIDLVYNRQRRQARLGYLSPVAYTQQFRRQRAGA